MLCGDDHPVSTAAPGLKHIYCVCLVRVVLAHVYQCSTLLSSRHSWPCLGQVCSNKSHSIASDCFVCHCTLKIMRMNRVKGMSMVRPDRPAPEKGETGSSRNPPPTCRERNRVQGTSQCGSPRIRRSGPVYPCVAALCVCCPCKLNGYIGDMYL